MKTIKFVVDNGHGIATPGKRSPNWFRGIYFEGVGNRTIVRHIKQIADIVGIDVSVLVPEDDDVSILDRVKRIRDIGKANNGNIAVCSVHSDAFENPNARGWSVYTSVGKTESDSFATCVFDAAKLKFPDRVFRPDYSDNDPDKEMNFAILGATKKYAHPYPAILTENFFMTNFDDYQLLTSIDGPRKLAELHIDGFVKYINQ
jgi:N-acetylmuramoyl-L-alanine amidase